MQILIGLLVQMSNTIFSKQNYVFFKKKKKSTIKLCKVIQDKQNNC